MKQPSIKARKALFDIKYDTPTIVPIKGTRRKVSIRALKDYTIDRITRLLIEHDARVSDDAEAAMDQYMGDPYIIVRQAVLVVLNSWWKINLFYKPMVFLWSRIYGYRQDQLTDILSESKKKLTEALQSYWMNMAFLTDMRADVMKMTKKEADQYQAELLSAMRQSLSRSTPNTEGQDASSSGL